MNRTRLFLMSVVAAATLIPAVAHAQHTATATFTPATTGNGRAFGVGAVGTFNGADRLSPSLLFTWGDNAGRFHVEGLFGFRRANDATNYDLGGRFWYHVHTARTADFSLGGGLAMFSLRDGGGDRRYDFELDVGAQVRLFLASNVAVLGSLGLGAYFPDQGDDNIAINGQFVGNFGFAYYFE